MLVSLSSVISICRSFVLSGDSVGGWGLGVSKDWMYFARLLVEIG
jgi:hypothetical protein